MLKSYQLYKAKSKIRCTCLRNGRLGSDRACVAERLLSKLNVRFIRKILCWQGNYVYLKVGRSNGRVFSVLQR